MFLQIKDKNNKIVLYIGLRNIDQTLMRIYHNDK